MVGSPSWERLSCRRRTVRRGVTPRRFFGIQQVVGRPFEERERGRVFEVRRVRDVNDGRRAVEGLGDSFTGERVDAETGRGGIVSWPISVSVATSFEPMSPVPPMTTIFMSSFSFLCCWSPRSRRAKSTRLAARDPSFEQVDLRLGRRAVTGHGSVLETVKDRVRVLADVVVRPEVEGDSIESRSPSRNNGLTWTSKLTGAPESLVMTALPWRSDTITSQIAAGVQSSETGDRGRCAAMAGLPTRMTFLCGSSSGRTGIRRRSATPHPLRSAAPWWPEEGLILLVDGDPIAVGIRHREGSPEWPIERLGEDRDAIGHHLLEQGLGIAGPPPELDARRVGRRRRQVGTPRGAQHAGLRPGRS